MRHNRQERPTTLGFRGGELRWLAMGVTTLAVLFLLISRLREPGAMGWLADVGQTPAKSDAPSIVVPLPKPTGPTDEDPNEAKLAKDQLRGLSDGTLGLGHEEMVPYNRLVSWVKNQSFARLWARGEKNLAYTYLRDDAPRQRGKLVALDVEIRLVRNAEKNDAGVPLYEAWATTKASGNHLYDLIVVDFPATMPVDIAIRERAKFAGYFLKVLGFESGVAQPGRAPEKAPLLIGRIEWKPTATPSQTDNRQEWLWAAAVLAIVVLVLGARAIFWKGKREKTVGHSNIVTPPSGGVIPVELWLEQCGSDSHEGDCPDFRVSENGTVPFAGRTGPHEEESKAAENDEYLDSGDGHNGPGRPTPSNRP